MTPSYFQAISGENGDLWARARKGKRSRILDFGSWILAGHGGATGNSKPLELFPSVWKCCGKTESVQGKGEFLEFGDLEHWECVPMD